MIAQVERFLVHMNHSLWVVAAIASAFLASLCLLSLVKNRAARGVLFSVIGVTLLLLCGGFSVNDLDAWQHQHGTCLLESLK